MQDAEPDAPLAKRPPDVPQRREVLRCTLCFWVRFAATYVEIGVAVVVEPPSLPPLALEAD